MTDSCPYCLSRPRNSEDHIFPKFLGGRATIRVCRVCNSRFGHTFEGAVSKNLAPLMVYLSVCGLKLPKRVVHEGAFTDATTGIEYDLDSNRHATPSRVVLERDENGSIRRVIAPRSKDAKRVLSSLKAKGLVKAIEVQESTIDNLRPPLHGTQIKIGPELYRLAIKMCLGLAARNGVDSDLLSSESRSFLIMKDSPNTSVQTAYLQYSDLDATRPPLSHVVYIEVNRETGKAFGVVQFFGTLQLYVHLNGRHNGPAAAFLGVLDPCARKETFRELEPLALAEAPRHISLKDYKDAVRRWETELNGQIRAAFGKNALIFDVSQGRIGTGLGVRLPLLWHEFVPAIELEMEVVPEEEIKEEVHLPSRATDWQFSTDCGESHVLIFREFAKRWNAQQVERSPGKAHEYAPEIKALRLLLGDKWCPVKALKIRYTVVRKVFLGSVRFSDCPGIVDIESGVLKATVKVGAHDIPQARQGTWIPVDDLEAVEKSLGNHIRVEKWDIDVDSLILEGMSLA